MAAQERRKSGSGFDTDFGKYLSSVDEVIDEARNGRMFILVDEEDRENEGDLVIPAQMATPEAINFMAKFGRGLICLSLPHERVEQLGLPLMARENNTRNSSPGRSLFCRCASIVRQAFPYAPPRHSAKMRSISRSISR